MPKIYLPITAYEEYSITNEELELIKEYCAKNQEKTITPSIIEDIIGIELQFCNYVNIEDISSKGTIITQL